MFKKLLIGMLFVFFSLGFVGSASAEDTGGFFSIDKAEMKAEAVVNISSLVKSPAVTAYGVAPVITNVEFYNAKDLNTPVTECKIGDELYISVYVTDPDLDCAYLTLAQYHPDDAVVPYWPPETASLPTQSHIDTMYYTEEPVLIVGPAGSWRVDFQVQDDAGNMSNIFEVYATTYDVGDEPPVGGGGGGSDGDGCFVSTLHKNRY